MAIIDKAGACVALAGVLLLGAAGSAPAADQGITGKKLFLKSTPKFLVLSKDASIHLSGSPVCPAADSSLTFSDGVHTHTVAMPCANWSYSGRVAKYPYPGVPGGHLELKVSTVHAPFLFAIGKGLGGFPVPNGAATVGVVLNLGGTIDRYCLSFSGTGDGGKFLVKDATAGSCPLPGS